MSSQGRPLAVRERRRHWRTLDLGDRANRRARQIGIHRQDRAPVGATGNCSAGWRRMKRRRVQQQLHQQRGAPDKRRSDRQTADETMRRAGVATSWHRAPPTRWSPNNRVRRSIKAPPRYLHASRHLSGGPNCLWSGIFKHHVKDTGAGHRQAHARQHAAPVFAHVRQSKPCRQAPRTASGRLVLAVAGPPVPPDRS